MPNWLIAWLIGIAVGLVIGRAGARDSAAAEPIRAGALAKAFHYAACVLIFASPWTAILISLFMGEGKFIPRLLTAVALVFFNLLLAGASLLAYGALESKARQAAG
jgi:hypothetical protein